MEVNKNYRTKLLDSWHFLGGDRIKYEPKVTPWERGQASTRSNLRPEQGFPKRDYNNIGYTQNIKILKHERHVVDD